MNGLSSSQLARLLSDDEHTKKTFRGIFNRLDIVISPLIDLNNDNIFVYLDRGHFVALIIGEVNYFIDPLGGGVPEDLQPTVDRWASPYRSEPDRAVQSTKSSLCGLFVYYYCVLLSGGVRRALPFDVDQRRNERILLDWYHDRRRN